MKPIIILPPNTVSADDIKLLRENELCVVVAENPSLVKFVDPIPAQSSRTEVEKAAIQLSRKLLNGQTDMSTLTNYRGSIAALFVDILMNGTRLDARFEMMKDQELRELAREEARAERKAAKAAAKEKK